MLYLVHKTFVLFKLNAADYKHYLNIGVNTLYNKLGVIIMNYDHYNVNSFKL